MSDFERLAVHHISCGFEEEWRAHEALHAILDLVRLEIDDDKAKNLASQYREELSRCGLLDELLPRSIDYSIRLADSGELIFEEAFKLLSLCDEIDGMRSLGLPGRDPGLVWEESLRRRFSAQASLFRLVAEDKVEDWSRAKWWYAVNLDGGG